MDIKDIRIDSLSKGELVALSNIIAEEIARRTRAAVHEYPPPTDMEKLWFATGKTVHAVREYRKRCTHFENKEVSVLEAVEVLKAA